MTNRVTLLDNNRKTAAGHGISRRLAPAIIAGTAMETVMTKLSLTLSLVTLLVAAPAFALEPLNKESHINDSLMAGRAADIIRNTCPSISAKMFVVMGALSDLKDYARAKGYDEADVKAFLGDQGEKDRIKAMANQYLANAGAVSGDAESYCKVGRDEIAKGTLAGSLLRSWK